MQGGLTHMEQYKSLINSKIFFQALFQRGHTVRDTTLRGDYNSSI